MAREVETTKDVRLVVVAIDGALATPDKVVTPRARAAVREIINRESLLLLAAPGLHVHENVNRRSSTSGTKRGI